MQKIDTASSITRRSFVAGTVAFAATSLRADQESNRISRRILVGNGTPDGILSFAWDAETGTLTPEGVAAPVSHSTWLEFSPDRRYLYAASEVNEFEGHPTGAVGSFELSHGKLTPISTVPAQGQGTCHLTTDETGRVVICANYVGGSAASFLPKEGKLGQAVWSERYTGHGPVADRQEAAHAHFARVSPGNRFVYINDLGSDKIHIYTLNAETGVLTSAGTYNAQPGDGPRTLHFHPHAKVAYCINELSSSISVLAWNKANGSLRPTQRVSLSPSPTRPDGTKISNTACDAVLTRDGLFAYFANRGDDFLMGFHIDPTNGSLHPFEDQVKTNCGGKTPRNFRLDPTERWMLVANQNSSNLSVFARNPKTGRLASEGTSVPAPTPMCIVFI